MPPRLRRARRGRRRRFPAARRGRPPRRCPRRRGPGPTAAPGETPITTSVNVRPAASRRRRRRTSTGGSSAAIAARAARTASAGARSISTSTFRRISRIAAAITRNATKSAATESPSGQPPRTASRPQSTASVPARSLPKWSAFDASAGLVNRLAARSETVVRVMSIRITTPTAANTHHAVEVSISIQPTSRATASAATATLTSMSTPASASAARCSALPWP